jgi:MFS family permease
MAAGHSTAKFYGWHVVAAVFVLATFGWGLGFYGPPVFLHTVQVARGWSLALISAAVTTHFLFGALVVANLPKLYKRFGVSAVTKAGCIALAAGLFGWAMVVQPWQLLLATLFSGAGWATMGAAAVNAIVSPWFVRSRAAALASAYNGSSVGGVIFSPLWVAAIGMLGFPGATLAIGLVMIAIIWVLADLYYAKTPEEMGLLPDGHGFGSTAVLITSPRAVPLPGKRLWRDRFIARRGETLSKADRLAFDQHFHEHPLVRFHAARPGGPTQRISDCMNARAFRNSALHADYYSRSHKISGWPTPRLNGFALR